MKRPDDHEARASTYNLYIPLRSDETYKMPFDPETGFIFISHYVQMKQAVRWKLIPRNPTLYPTTFRWNPCF